MSRSRLAIWNYASTIVFTFVTLLGLAVTRYVTELLGDSRFGAARMVSDWMGIFAIFEIAFGSTLAPLAARALARNDLESLHSAMNAGLRTLARLIGVLFFVGLAMLAFVGWLVPTTEINDLRLAWCIGLIGLLPMILSPFRALAEARQFGYRVNLAIAGQSLLVFALSVAFARVGFGITGQVAATTISSLLLAAFLTRDGLRSFPGLVRAVRQANPERDVWRTIARLGVPTFLVALSGRISVLTDSLIVGKIIDPAIAARLIFTLKLITTGQTQLQAIGNACWAALAELHAQGQRETFNTRLIELTEVVTILGIAGFGPVVAYNRYFVTFWMGADRYLGDGIVVLAAINGLFLGLFSLWFWCFSGTGRIAAMLPAVVAGAITNFVSSVVFTHLFGAIGPICGTSMGFVAVSLWYLPFSLRKHFGTPIRRLFGAVERPLRVGLPFTIALYYLANSHMPWGWFGLGLEMTLAALVYLALAFLLVIDRRQRAVWIARVQGALRRS